MIVEPTERRETLALATADARLVDRLMDPTSLERWALESVTGIEPDASKSTVPRAAFRIGTDRITEIAMDEGYRQLAEQSTTEESADDRAITMSRRRRTRAEDAE
ncbi:hypothetical protein SAMN04487819_109260 [Actinopolyspora alba]|uniref:Uncharacterized protein n=1 Tax=Actinopolyspora alba TaxID=673379 RepID=A0A1I1YUX8_9ACTN|nr:hypothetical protein [Actinopolyspora alba]SFE23251.1 hypothetical protein SAMN04487819_109260 [Actinopolyspora alba]